MPSDSLEPPQAKVGRDGDVIEYLEAVRTPIPEPRIEAIAFRLCLVAAPASVALGLDRAAFASYREHDLWVHFATAAPLSIFAAFYAIRWAIAFRFRPLFPLR